MNPVTGQPTILLTGATGQVGVFAIPRLLDAGYPVIAMSRKVSRTDAAAEISPDTVRWVHPDDWLIRTDQPEALWQAVGPEGVGILVSCGPVELAARLAPLCPNLRRIVCISTSSVHTKANSPNVAERMLISEISAAEEALKSFCQAQEITLLLLRPTMIYGCGLDQNISRIARLIRRFGFIPLAGKAAGLRQPVHADDLAALVLSAVESQSLSSMETPVGGGSVLSYCEMVEKVFTGLGRSPRILKVPTGLLVMLVRAVSWLPRMGGLNAGFALRQNLDMVFDDAWLRGLLDFKPRPFEPTAADFEMPVSARTHQPPHSRPL